MLKQADGSYACVAESATRFTLGEVRTGYNISAPGCFLSFTILFFDLLFGFL